MAAGLTGIACALMLALVPGRWTTSPANGTRLMTPGPKVNAEYAVAARVTAVADPHGLILAPESVGVWIATHPDHPPLVAARRLYLEALPHRFTRLGADTRKNLLAYIDGRGVSEVLLPPVLDQVESLPIATIVVPAAHPVRTGLSAGLLALGFVSTPAGPFEIWRRPDDSAGHGR